MVMGKFLFLMSVYMGWNTSRDPVFVSKYINTNSFIFILSFILRLIKNCNINMIGVNENNIMDVI